MNQVTSKYYARNRNIRNNILLEDGSFLGKQTCELDFFHSQFLLQATKLTLELLP